jgi:hypothetical protein
VRLWRKWLLRRGLFSQTSDNHEGRRQRGSPLNTFKKMREKIQRRTAASLSVLS